MTPERASVVVEAAALSKSFGATKALEQVQFQVNAGEIFGLIGADGAGKTTIFRILAGVLAPSGGQATVFGLPPRDARDRVGYLTQPFSLYQDLSIRENVDYAAGLREVPKKALAERSEHYLKLFDLDRFQERLAGRLSGGMKQKLALTCALIAGPSLLLLDEPTTGVDPVTRRDFWDALTSLATTGMTIVVATPYLDEAERCHRVALIERGRIHQTDSPAGFRAGLGLTRLELHSDELQRVEQLLTAEDTQRFGDRLDIMAVDPERTEQGLRQLLGSAGVRVTEIRRSKPTLENAFVAQLRALRGAPSRPAFPRPAPALESRDVALGASNLNKRFGSFQAVKNFHLEVRHGEIYGLLGANGAGKTTAIKMMCGLLTPTSGEVMLLGKRKNLRSAAIRSRLGYMSQKFTLYNDLTIAENLDFYGRLFGVPDDVREARKQWVLDIAELKGQENMLTADLPGGWKQRVAFGAAVMHEPAAIFLDEPTSGVDPLARRAMWRMINELADRGAGILVVTHYLEEAEQCNRLGFMVAGEIISEGSPSDVKGRMKGAMRHIATSEPQRALLLLREAFGASRVSLFGDSLHLVTESPQEGEVACRQLAEHGISVHHAEAAAYTLEDVFISLIEERRGQIPA